MLESNYQNTNKAINTNSRSSFFQRRARQILQGTGIEINGPNPWDIQVKNADFYRRTALQGSLGLGEAYLDGWWECHQLDEFFSRILNASVDTEHRFLSHIFAFAKASFRNLQTRRRAFQVGEAHYDLGNDVYHAMLDKRLVYTCAYWERAKDLDSAQEDKLELTCRKLGLQPGMKVLDIGCGWGSFARYAAEKYHVEVTGVTISQEQIDLGRELCAGLPVTLQLKDYREVEGQFDRIVSLGMFEHVGHKNYAAYMDLVARCLVDHGLFVLQTIGKSESRPGVDPWIDKYIFPNGETPSLKQISTAAEYRLVIEDVHNFGADYDKTLVSWYQNFHTAWPELQKKYPETFYRTWKYYLLSCAGAFRARDIHLWQIVFSKGGVPGSYRRPTLE